MQTPPLGQKIKVKKFRKHLVAAIKHQAALRTAAENLADAHQSSGERMWDLIKEAYPETKDRHCSVRLTGKNNKQVEILFLDGPKEDDTSTS